MSPTKRTSTTRRTSKLSPEDKKAWLTTWQDTSGVRHHALAQRRRDDLYLIDVLTPCTGYIRDALDNTGTEMAVTCAACIVSRFAVACKSMNLDVIETLDEETLVDHFVDRDAMSILYDPW